MNRLNRIALSVGALLVMSASILAQTPTTPTTPPAAAIPKVKGLARGGQGRRAGMASLPVSALDALVTLTADQKTKITGIEDKLKTDTVAASGDKVKTRELTTAANADIKAVLTPTQQTTLNDALPVVMLLNQSKAVPAAAFGDVKLTSDQMAKIKTMAAGTQDKLKALTKDDRKTQNPILLSDFKTQVDTVLTDDQKAAISKVHAPKGRKKIKA